MTGARCKARTLPTQLRQVVLAPWRNQRGMALLITVMILSLLVVVTLGYYKTTWQKYVASHNHKVNTQLKAIAGSAVQLGYAFLQYDGGANSTDSFFDLWAAIKDEDLRDLFPTGTAHLEIIDLSGRLQINSLVRQKGGGGKKGLSGRNRSLENETRAILLRLLLSDSFAISNELQAQQLVDALVDWLDADDLESDYGAENSYYRSLDPPYGCKNGPVEYIEELLLVKGITPELLFGTATTKGLADYLTVFGDNGKININTASRLILKSLDPLMNDDLTDRLEAFRRDVRNAAQLADPEWYKNIGGWPGDIVIYENLLTTESSYFQINGAGRYDNLVKRVTAVVERVDRAQVTMLWRKVE
ncbi:MAG: type II secretion system minor pseudopilin GspK [Proteobacteria bacterium]|nr:type II secretion system minor pseudopilin GspK [Pseudomonadota bacterium]